MCFLLLFLCAIAIFVFLDNVIIHNKGKKRELGVLWAFDRFFLRNSNFITDNIEQSFIIFEQLCFLSKRMFWQETDKRKKRTKKAMVVTTNPQDCKILLDTGFPLCIFRRKTEGKIYRLMNTSNEIRFLSHYLTDLFVLCLYRTILKLLFHRIDLRSLLNCFTRRMMLGEKMNPMKYTCLIHFWLVSLSHYPSWLVNIFDWLLASYSSTTSTSRRDS